jgi:predicted dehydrogenase
MYGKVLLRWLQADERAEIVWVNSASEATTRAAADEFGIPRWTLDYQEVLADPAVDAVVIATPPYLHKDQFLTALAAGKHILMEKPLAASAQDARAMAAAAEQHPQLITLDASCRHARLQPKFRAIKEMIDSGKLGTIYHIHHNHLTRGTFIEWNPKGAWAMDKKLAGGGPFIDWGVYDLSFHLGLLNDTPELISVHSFARSDLRDIRHLVEFSDVEQHGAAWLEFSGGLTYYYERGAGVHGETACETRITGTRGGLRFCYPSWETAEIEFFSADPDPRKETFTVELSNAPDDSQVLVQHFLDCLDGSVQPLMPIQRAAKHMEILYKILA